MGDVVIRNALLPPPKEGTVDEQKATPTGKRPYERPRILWTEPYEPHSFGLSCAKQPGNPMCNPGPSSS